ncbi:D-alanyl-D-alanine carboxypeptidase [Microbacterium esteraromaticum]|uniref:D-alanyl-D-alanine carboxypeptidase n=1 Tax=Microbacterium esteraromaticum TaxID=57043 RepID=A0A1R4KQN5_9MICO|nr:M15 family metallopeptidase [Microbacterium esteraromaticum]SJN46324.1 D-alanyl-D-alanine carboxypeptidase [Microbacterium esteraromaticum]
MSVTQPRHAVRAPLAVRVATPIGVLFTAAASLATLMGISAIEPIELPAPAAAMVLPGVELAETTAANPCVDDDVTAALAAGDDAAVVHAFGGGSEFREAVVAGNAPCVTLDDPKYIWVVVNKMRPLQPESFAPASLTGIGLYASTGSNELRPAATDALEAMAADAAAAGAGTLGINNGYRSYHVQQRTYGTHVRELGQSGADAISARPGYSEHQSGLAFDLIACASGCSSLEQFGDTSQGRWVAENAWKYGFIVRYERGHTGTTGYLPEPWHIRYVGVDLAAAYHQGGFHTLEEFFGLPDAPDYAH